MNSRTMNVSLRDGRDEPAILHNLSGSPLRYRADPTPHAPILVEQWRKTIDWVNQSGSVTLFYEEAKYINGDSNPCLQETLADIGGLTALQEDWDDEGAPEIDRASILRAKKFVQWLACAATEHKLLEDCGPAVFPTIDGGVKLYWKVRRRQIALIFRRGQNLIEIVEKALGEVDSRKSVSENEAGEIAITAMREAV